MSTYQGLAVPIYSDTGIEMISVSSTGGITFNEEVVFSGGTYAGLTGVLSSTLQEGAVRVSVTSTGALADATVTSVNGFVVAASSKSVMNSVLMYDTVAGGTASVSTAVSYLAVNGTKAPSYFLKLSGSVYGTGAAEANGFSVSPREWELALFMEQVCLHLLLWLFWLVRMFITFRAIQIH